MCQILLVVHASVQPYKRRRTNITETIYLFVLCLLAIIETLDDIDTRSTACAVLVSLVTIHSFILCIIKFYYFCKKKCHCRLLKKLSVKIPGKYQTFDDNSEYVRGPAVSPEVRAKQNLFDTVFATSTESSSDSPATNSKSYTY